MAGSSQPPKSASSHENSGPRGPVMLTPLGERYESLWVKSGAPARTDVWLADLLAVEGGFAQLADEVEKRCSPTVAGTADLLEVRKSGERIYVIRPVPAKTIEEQLGTLPRRDALATAARIARAVSRLHAASRLHGGLAPHSISPSEPMHLFDASIDALLEEYSLPGEGIRWAPGKAPELWGSPAGSAESDVYSLAVVLGLLIFGRRFLGDLADLAPSGWQAWASDAQSQFPGVALIDGELAKPELAAIWKRALHKSMLDRDVTADALAAAFERAADMPPQSAPPPPRPVKAPEPAPRPAEAKRVEPAAEPKRPEPKLEPKHEPKPEPKAEPKHDAKPAHDEPKPAPKAAPQPTADAALPKSESLSPEHLAGCVVADYQVLRRVGGGGMGIVYEAIQQSLRRRVALKVLPSELVARKDLLERFHREARAAASLLHRNLVTVFATGAEGIVHYIAMEFVDGMGLDRIIEEHKQAMREKNPLLSTSSVAASSFHVSYVKATCDAIAGVAEALHEAHKNGVIHRDVKPQNILVSLDGVPKLVDFGLARDERDESLSVAGSFIGTYVYASPEQIIAKGGLDGRCDIYALGVTMYEMLALRRPFEGTSDEIYRRVKVPGPPPIETYNPRIPKALSDIIMKALAKEPKDRYPTGVAFAEALRAFVVKSDPIELLSASPLLGLVNPTAPPKVAEARGGKAASPDRPAAEARLTRPRSWPKTHSSPRLPVAGRIAHAPAEAKEVRIVARDGLVFRTLLQPEGGFDLNLFLPDGSYDLRVELLDAAGSVCCTATVIGADGVPLSDASQRVRLSVGTAEPKEAPRRAETPPPAATPTTDGARPSANQRRPPSIHAEPGTAQARPSAPMRNPPSAERRAPAPPPPSRDASQAPRALPTDPRDHGATAALAGRFERSGPVEATPFGATFKANGSDDRPAEVTVFSPEWMKARPAAVERLLAETRISGQLGDWRFGGPLYTCESPSGAWIVVHEADTAPSLAAMVASRTKLEKRQALSASRALLETLQLAHDSGCIHGAIDLDKIILDLEMQETVRARISGFGRDWLKALGPRDEVAVADAQTRAADVAATARAIYSIFVAQRVLSGPRGPGRDAIARSLKEGADELSQTSVDVLAAAISQDVPFERADELTVIFDAKPERKADPRIWIVLGAVVLVALLVLVTRLVGLW